MCYAAMPWLSYAVLCFAFDGRGRRLVVDREVERGEVDLAHHQVRGVNVLRRNQRINRRVRKGIAALVVAREAADDGTLPAPVLKHLRWSLDEIAGTFSEARRVCFALGAQPVHDVAELVEESHHVVVPQQLQ